MPGLEGFAGSFGWIALLGAAAALAAGGFAKGVVGFALPLVALSIMASFLPVKVAVALLVVPILVSNLFQALRHGLGEAWGSFVKYRRLNLVFVATIAVVAQLVVLLPDVFLFALLGVSITAFGVSQLLGWRPRISRRAERLAEVGAGFAAGVFGGLAGIWGPPLIIYLLAAGVPKVEMIRVQSLTFLLGAIVLLAAHLRSGLLDAVTLPASTWLVAPTMAAMFLGYRVQDRLDQEVFRRITLAVLVLAGLNLLRRAFGG